MKKTILFVSDSQNTNAIFGAILSTEYLVFCVQTPEEAFGILAENRINLIITTLRHKKNSCFDFIEELRQMDSDVAGTPVIIVANVVNSELIANSHKNDVSDFLRLPIEPLEFMGKVSGILMKFAQSYEKLDPVTGFHKKQYTEQQISEMLAVGKKGALFLIELDKYSFASGKVSDNVLKKCSDVLKEIADRETTVCVTSNGFLIFSQKVRTKVEIEQMAQNIIDLMLSGNEPGKVFISMGLAVTDRHGSNYEDLYHFCDMGLGVSRQNGKNCAKFYKW